MEVFRKRNFAKVYRDNWVEGHNGNLKLTEGTGGYHKNKNKYSNGI